MATVFKRLLPAQADAQTTALPTLLRRRESVEVIDVDELDDNIYQTHRVPEPGLSRPMQPQRLSVPPEIISLVEESDDEDITVVGPFVRPRESSFLFTGWTATFMNQISVSCENSATVSSTSVPVLEPRSTSSTSSSTLCRANLASHAPSGNFVRLASYCPTPRSAISVRGQHASTTTAPSNGSAPEYGFYKPIP